MNAPQSTLRNPTGRLTLTLAFAIGALAVLGASGCDELATGAYWPTYDWGYYPDYGLYDPTNDIQSVISYRQDVMDWSNDAWSDYILQ